MTRRAIATPSSARTPACDVCSPTSSCSDATACGESPAVGAPFQLPSWIVHGGYRTRWTLSPLRLGVLAGQPHRRSAF